MISFPGPKHELLVITAFETAKDGAPSPYLIGSFAYCSIWASVVRQADDGSVE
jgi:hypothetical protein